MAGSVIVNVFVNNNVLMVCTMPNSKISADITHKLDGQVNSQINFC